MTYIMKIVKMGANIILIALLCSCKESYAEQLHLKGSVKYLETITDSRIPVDTYIVESGELSSILGNYSIRFNRLGNIAKIKIYDEYGNLNNTDLVKMNTLVSKPIVDGNDELKYVRVFDSNGRVDSLKIFDRDTLVGTSKLFYNNNGELIKVLKVMPYFHKPIYGIGYVDSLLLHVAMRDTTDIEYRNRDSKGNWTMASVKHKTPFGFSSFEYNIYRQVTYWGEKQKPSLIADYDKYQKRDLSSAYVKLETKLFFGRMSVSLPERCRLRRDSQENIIPYSFEHNGKTCWMILANNPVNVSRTDYYSVSKEVYEEYFDAQLAAGGIKTLKGVSRSFEKIRGREYLVSEYYRSDVIPFHVRIYEYIDNGYAYGVTLSYSTAEADFFEPIVKNIKNSIYLY